MSPERPDVTVVGRLLGEEDQRVRDFFTRAAQPFTWVEAGSERATELLAANDLSEADLPVVLADGETVTRATPENILANWNISTAPSKRNYDLLIVGAGPAGLAAAVYAASDGLSTLVLEEDLPGGQASYTSLIENFFGFPDGIGGAELARRAGRQAEQFGAELAIRYAITGGNPKPEGGFEAIVDGSIPVEATVCIAAPGMIWRRLEVEGVDELLGRGIYYGAGRSEAVACEDREVIVVGGGNSAGQAAVHLSSVGARVLMLVRSDKLARSMSAYLVKRIEAAPLVEVRLETCVVGIESEEGRLTGVVAEDATGARERLPAEMMFLCLGGEPRTGWAVDAGLPTDSSGYVLAGPDLLQRGKRRVDWPLGRDPLALETGSPGLFIAGDARHGSVKRVGAAVGEGAMAVALAERRLRELESEG